MKPKKAKFRLRRPRRHPLAFELGLTFWLIVLAICLGSGGAVGAFVGWLNAQTPIKELEYYSPPQVTRFLDGSGSETVAEFYIEKREVVGLAEMPPELPNAFIAIEDERFRKHVGADPRGILRAFYTNMQRHWQGSPHGGSTITQQMARNALARIGTERSLARKIREAFMALQIEARYSKDQIIEFYLNQIPLGPRSYGVQAAAQTYFDKDVRDLDLAECAALATIPKAPSVITPIANPDKVIARRKLVLDSMVRLGMVEAEAAEAAKAVPLPPPRPKRSRIQAPYFIFHAAQVVEKALKALPEYAEEENLLDRGGFRIHTTVNTAFQNVLEEEMPKGLAQVEALWREAKESRLSAESDNLLEKHGTTSPQKGQARLARIKEVKKDGLEVEIEGYRGFVPFMKEFVTSSTASASEEPAATGEGYRFEYLTTESLPARGNLIDVKIEDVSRSERSMRLSWYDTWHVQGAAILLDVATGHILAEVGGNDFYDVGSRGMFNRAVAGTGRQPGSAFKPLIYAAAIKNGKKLNSITVDEKIEYAGGYTPRNYSNSYQGPTTLIGALSHSNNAVTVKIFNALGKQKSYETYRAFDITEPQGAWTLPQDMQLPLCLGSLDATPLSIAAAYVPFARGGLAIEPLCATHVENAEGEAVLTFKPRERSVISEQTAYLVGAMLREAFRNGTGRNAHAYFEELKLKVPEMGAKTGTTTDCVDAWFVGFTPELVLAVRVGFDQGQRSLGPQMTGGRVALPIWCDMMRRILETRSDWKMQFDKPDGIVERDISQDTGLLASTYEREQGENVFYNVPFVKGTEPTRTGDGSTYREQPRADSSATTKSRAVASPDEEWAHNLVESVRREAASDAEAARQAPRPDALPPIPGLRLPTLDADSTATTATPTAPQAPPRSQGASEDSPLFLPPPGQ